MMAPMVIPKHVMDEAAKFITVQQPFPIRPESADALAEFEARFGFSLLAACLHPELRRMLQISLAEIPEQDDGVVDAMEAIMEEDFGGE